jgi:hypothetical protein
LATNLSAQLGPVRRVTATPHNFEPHVTVDPTDSERLAAIAIRTSERDCRQRPREACDVALYLHLSRDGGTTWAEEARLTEGPGKGYDGMVAAGPDGSLYATGMETPGIFVFEWPSRRWAIETTAPCDKPWLTIDPASGDLYLVYTRVPDLVLRTSRDGGGSWSDPAVVAKGPETFSDGKQVEVPPWGGQALLGRAGELAVTWLWSPGMDSMKALERLVWLATSPDRGATFSEPRLIGPSRGAPSAVCHGGGYYVVYEEAERMVAAVSEDGGRTWSRHVVSGDLVLHPALNPAPGVGVSPNGTVDVVFYNPTTPDCFDFATRFGFDRWSGEQQFVDGCTYDVFYAHSRDGCRTWSEPLRLNERPIEGREFLLFQNASRPGEYVGMASTDRHAHPVWIEGVHVCTRRIAR